MARKQTGYSSLTIGDLKKKNFKEFSVEDLSLFMEDLKIIGSKVDEAVGTITNLRGSRGVVVPAKYDDGFGTEYEDTFYNEIPQVSSNPKDAKNVMQGGGIFAEGSLIGSPVSPFYNNSINDILNSSIQEQVDLNSSELEDIRSSISSSISALSNSDDSIYNP